MTEQSPRVLAAAFGHLARLSDDTGLSEHARSANPRREHGYCLDDVARGLVVVCREPNPGPALDLLAERYLAFTAHAQGPDGGFRNRLGFDRRWQDEPSVGDWWGRALWGLGTAAARSPLPWVRDDAMYAFESGVLRRSPWPHSMAFAALGAAEVLAARPGHQGAGELLGDAALLIARRDPGSAWPWPRERLTYANAVLPEVLIAAGELLGDAQAARHGRQLLGWLLSVESEPGHLSPTPSGGRAPGDPRPAFDQQPIEAAALADACARAFDADGDPRWAHGVALASGWFLGANDKGAALHDAHSGGGYDGLHALGHSLNQGAESTLALISTLQQDIRTSEGRL